MLQQYGMRLFYGFFAALLVGMGVLTQIDADLPETEATFVIDGQVAAAELHIEVPVGALAVKSIDDADEDALLVGHFEFEDEDVPGSVSFNDDGDVGRLVVAQGGDTASSQTANVYDVEVSRALPLDVQVTRERGDSLLDLQHLNLRRVNMELGDGHNTLLMGTVYPLLQELLLTGGHQREALDIRCDCPQLEVLEVDSTEGDDQVLIDGSFPQLITMRLDTGGHDDAVLLDGDYSALSTMDVELGRGNDRLVLAGAFPATRLFVIDTSIGDDEIDLSQLTGTALNITIVTHTGSVRVYLPTDSGAAVSVVGNDADVSVTNLDQDGDLWVNAAYAPDTPGLMVTITTSGPEVVELVGNPPREPLIERAAVLPALTDDDQAE